VKSIADGLLANHNMEFVTDELLGQVAGLDYKIVSHDSGFFRPHAVAFF